MHVVRSAESAAPARNKKAEAAPDSGEGEAFGQQLPDEPATRRAERQAHRDFSPPRHRAGEQQVCHVRADDHSTSTTMAVRIMTDRNSLMLPS